jgi:adenine C2-methylase RlmN of 23S rRNA A2503 and tRNA A37
MMASPFPSFHDGRLTSIAVAEKSATLGLLRSDGLAFELKLVGVEAFRADQFWEGNIIMHIEVVQGQSPLWTNVRERLADLFPPPHPDAASLSHDAYMARLRRDEDRIAKGNAVLVSLEPSYGCDLVALCSEVTLEAQP